MLNIDWSEINKIHIDKFNRVSGIFAIDKPEGVTSHDIVNQVRKILGIRKVGHAGALDPFATGMLLILAGSRYTRKTEMLIKLDKQYITEVLLGVGTDSHDIDGYVVDVEKDIKIDNEQLAQVIEGFNKNYNQTVPVFSSVKVSGMKLRELARSSDSYEFIEVNGKECVNFTLNDASKRKFKNNSESGVVLVELPVKNVDVDIELIEIGEANPSKLGIALLKEIDSLLPTLKLKVDCSKGTYIRRLASDIGTGLSTLGTLINLRRTRIGSIKEDQMIQISDLEKLADKHLSKKSK